MTTHFITTHPTTGQVAARSSASRTYTHACWGRLSLAAQERIARSNIEAIEGHIAEYEAIIASGVSNSKYIPIGDFPGYLERAQENLAEQRAKLANLSEDTWGVLGWQGRPDLAQKAAGSWAKKGYEVVISEAVVVASKTEQKRAIELAGFNLTTTDGETYSLADDAELSDAELAEAREIADTPAEPVQHLTQDVLLSIAQANVQQPVGITLADGRSFSTKILAVIAHPGTKPSVLVKGWAYEYDFNPFAVVKYPLAQVADFAPFGADQFVAV